MREIENIVQFENEKEILQKKLNSEIFSKENEISKYENENKNILSEIK